MAANTVDFENIKGGLVKQKMASKNIESRTGALDSG